ncbi:MAG: hypothetical protein JWO91_2350 [Acidobacteriaceae bacterium]|nr:hypothetical protein [Acidobacteriaceae bacterium]
MTILLHEVGDEIVNLPLPPSDRHGAIVGERKANVKNEVRQSGTYFASTCPPLNSAEMPRMQLL